LLLLLLFCLYLVLHYFFIYSLRDLRDLHSFPTRRSSDLGVAQPHCHQHAVMGWTIDATLLAEAGASIVAVGGCCGLAGNFGVEKDRKSTRLNSSHQIISYAVFCLKKKNRKRTIRS